MERELSAAVSDGIDCGGGETAYWWCEREGGGSREVWHLRFAAELLSRITCAREAEEGGITIVYWFRWQAQVPKRWVRSSIVLIRRGILSVQWEVVVRRESASKARVSQS